MICRRLAELSDDDKRQLFERGSDIHGAMQAARAILDDVKEHGDDAVRKYTLKFDRVDIRDIRVSEKEIEQAFLQVDKKLIAHLDAAAANIRKFHELQMPSDWKSRISPGITLGQRTTPLDSVGAYVPGGRASYPSTALMTVIPAKVAGVREVSLCTPPMPDGSVNPLTLVAAKLGGADRIFRIGGVQAVAAMAHGTGSVPKVEKIVGPGNVYVTAAKMLLRNTVEIDFPAGPSEVLIIADSTAAPELIASDMVAQAEHDPDAVAVLVTDSEKVARDTERAVAGMVGGSDRKTIISRALEHSFIITADTLDECVGFANRFAPEHLELMTKADLLPMIRNAGSIFVGEYAPVSAGDYASGTNHVLPTAGYARVFSGLNVDHFMKKSSVQIITREGLEGIRDAIVGLAEAEGLRAHADAVRLRFKTHKT